MTFLLFIVVILFVLAILDLVVGVSNDAVNFLNSAIGSKVANYKTIIIIAAAGVIMGALFSNGIMEITRKGIFFPDFFTLDKVLYIFLAVMLTDILLLDMFNTLGLPTSTTVSIIFELLGAALVAGVLFSIEKEEPVKIISYINTGSVMTIIVGIFLSIIIAFLTGMLVQYGCRLLFTFNYEEKLKRYGSLYAGFGTTAIIYFLLVKGLKGTTLISSDVSSWISAHLYIVLPILCIAGVVVTELMYRIWGINPLKVVVLMGTFSLAMAFAGNDLVNFIGVPITGFLAFEAWKRSGIAMENSYQHYLMQSDIIVPNYMLLIAGIIMAATIWLSAKAKKVTETEVKLGSQGEGEERFQPTAISRNIVKTSLLLANLIETLVPKGLKEYYSFSFEKSKIRQATLVHDKPAFDLVRASSNLILASSLIALATSFKLPLSTTYVSFMVAMGTSLADKAWGRETAVYRVAGVLSVIGGWFITAFIAFIVSACFVFVLIKGGVIGTIISIAFVFAMLIFSHIRFSKKERKENEQRDKLSKLSAIDTDIYESNKDLIIQHLYAVSGYYSTMLESLKSYDEELVSTTYENIEILQKDGFKLRSMSIKYIKNLQNNDKKQAEILLYGVDLLQDMTHSLHTMAEETNFYIKNLHQKPSTAFIRISEELRFKMNAFMQAISLAIGNNNFENIDSIKTSRDDMRLFINQQLDTVILQIQEKKPTTKEAILETTILLQSRDILAVALRIMKMYKQYLQK